MRNSDPFDRCAQALARDLLNISAYLAHHSSTRRQDLGRARTDILGALMSVNAALGGSDDWLTELLALEDAPDVPQPRRAAQPERAPAALPRHD